MLPSEQMGMSVGGYEDMFAHQMCLSKAAIPARYIGSAAQPVLLYLCLKLLL